MGWLWAIIVGFVLGVIAKAVIPGKQHSPLWLTTICGILGAIAGNAIARALNVHETRGIDWSRHIFQLVAAIIIVAVVDSLYVATLGKRKQRQRV
ncbi:MULTISPECIES: GlsB/YeaQ/YmgE family stress response membrane protein [Streptomyces]|uniref:Putative membrane protein YeaQ/YmgE (Transglycosylase-associated protein family) n=1 Tax=Streptomyces murinus TaxID=33900 RepID=A0A7W3NLP2_STRMR|nr:MULTISPECIES: GlsB/YeaQ/YmgE family stress response membrane protein [Streptomyces]NDK28964.1 GlsB/YeaQ/YmgE family stress response membrane protein [Streptomyces sp. TR1341]MBA9052836.1 putative membrane protein YeaQ/YmgE (transglycosylase-associated protein family) [Streptomyces murinus]UWW94028.1 GlsB/YeaQ/YmgE family stress response membrane protein [Streptomyces murinus]WSI84737.1 GlsB/YeaQ/YmgE family stress response membrane protein [Streptomyces murinus]WUD06445.1 GlsB/YeaQ/YmgE fam